MMMMVELWTATLRNVFVVALLETNSSVHISILIRRLLHIAVAQEGCVAAIVDGWMAGWMEGEGEIVGINNIQMIEGGGGG